MLIRYAFDRFGPVKTGLASAMVVALGYTGMSYCPPHLWVLALLSYMLVGIDFSASFYNYSL